MALSTLPDNRENEKLDPGQKHYEDTIGSGYSSSGIDQLEAFANDPKNHTAQSLEDAEQKGTLGDSADNSPADIHQRESEGDKTAASTIPSTYTGAKNKEKSKRRVLFKRAAPLVGVGGALFGGGLIFIMLTSPTLLIVHVKEIFNEKFNTSLGSANVRTVKLNNTKINKSTSGICAGPITLKCKFSTMSDTQVKNFADAGIEVVPDGEVVNGRTKPAAYKFKDKTITAGEFARLSSTDPDFASALKQAYNPKFAAFKGRAWAAVAKFFGVSKKPTDLSGSDDAERQKKLNDYTKKGETDSGGKIIQAGDEKPGCTTGGSGCKYTQAEADAANKQAASVGTALAQDGESGAAASKVRNFFSGTPLKSITSAFAITGALDGYCTAQGTLNAISYAGKAISVLSLARVFWTYANMADQIKSGDSPDPAETNFLGNKATTVTKDSTGKTTVGSLTDSFGYKYAAYGDTSASNQSMLVANRFLAGGGLVGSLALISKNISSVLGGRAGAQKTCGVLANPVVQGVSLIAGVALLFVPGANVVGGAIKLGASLAGGIALSAVLAMLPNMLSDIVAGTVTQDISGEEVGDAMASGGGAMLSNSLASQNGNGLMTKDDALAYSTLQTSTTNEYIADDVKNDSPFDATNPHTFLGSIASTLMPLSSQANPLGFIGSALSTSFASIIPKTNAASTQQAADALNVCQDQDAIDAGYAVDPFCNPIRGIPTQYLNKDPLQVVDELVASGDMSADGTPQNNYASFINTCITGTEPPGYQQDTTFNVDLAKQCIVNDSNANYYLNYQDQRIERGMSGEDTEDAASAPVNITDKKALAQKIVAKNKVKYMDNSQPTLERIANGEVDPNAMPCGININILKIIDAITDQHSITISDINRLCNGTVQASGNGSRHNAGNGSAIDIAVIDGKATNGRDANALALIGIAMPILSQAATSSGSYSQVGQSECGANPAMGVGVSLFQDSCTHLHLDVPPKSDPNLKYDPSGW